MIRLITAPFALAVLAITCGAQDSAFVSRFRNDWNHAKPVTWDGAPDISTLSAPQHIAVIKAIKRWRHLGTEQEAGLMADDLVITMMLLGSARRKEMVARGTGQMDCSPTGNCSIWIFQRAGNRYRVILESLGQTLSTLPSRTSVYQDILVSMHGSATETALKVYKFDGSRYKRAASYNASFEVLDKDGNIQELSEPRMTSCRSQ